VSHESKDAANETSNDSDDDDDDDNDDDDDDDDNDDESEVIDLSGMKCRAPYTHSWGEMSYHNAIISCILPEQSQVLM